MSFILQNYSRASVSYNKDSFVGYHFKQLADTVAEINADDYFLSQQASLEIDDLIQVQASDGLVTLKITALTPKVTTAIAIQSLDENGDVVFNTVQVKNLNGGGRIVLTIINIGQDPQLVDSPDLISLNGGISSGGATEATAVMQSDSTDKGWLPPRMTTAERDAIAFPAEGIFIFNTTTDTLDIRAGGVWKTITAV